MKVAERGMNNSDEEFWAMQKAGSKDEVKHVGRSGEWLWVMMMVWSEWHKVKSACCDHEEAEQIQGHGDMVAGWYLEFFKWEKWLIILNGDKTVASSCRNSTYCRKLYYACQVLCVAFNTSLNSRPENSVGVTFSKMCAVFTISIRTMWRDDFRLISLAWLLPCNEKKRNRAFCLHVIIYYYTSTVDRNCLSGCRGFPGGD